MPGPRRTYCEFRNDPSTSKRGGGAATGAAGDRNLMVFGGHGLVPGCVFEWHVKGTQTLLAPVITAAGLDVGSQDQTADDGIEITQGITAGSPSAFVIGTDAFYLKILDLVIADVSGTDDCAFGFRLAAAYQAAIDNYTDFAVINVISGDVKTESTVNDAATTTTDSLVDFADGNKRSLLIKVDKSGVATFFYSTDAAFDSAGNPQPQSWTQLNSAVTFTFDSGDTVIPFLYMLFDTTSPGAITVRGWDCGLQ